MGSNLLFAEAVAIYIRHTGVTFKEASDAILAAVRRGEIDCSHDIRGSKSEIVIDALDLYITDFVEFLEFRKRLLTGELDEYRSKGKSEPPTWEGFDEASEVYPPELDIAMQAWRAVTYKPDPDPRKEPKAQVKAWLDTHYPKMPKAAKERISMICNWNRKGGAKPKK